MITQGKLPGSDDIVNIIVDREIIPGHSADIILFEYKDDLVVKSTWIHGEKV
jgi:hypothetical protein